MSPSIFRARARRPCVIRFTYLRAVHLRDVGDIIRLLHPTWAHVDADMGAGLRAEHLCQLIRFSGVPQERLERRCLLVVVRIVLDRPPGGCKLFLRGRLEIRAGRVRRWRLVNAPTRAEPGGRCDIAAASVSNMCVEQSFRMRRWSRRGSPVGAMPSTSRAWRGEVTASITDVTMADAR